MFSRIERTGADKIPIRPTMVLYDAHVWWPREFVTSTQNETAIPNMPGLTYLRRTLIERQSLHWGVLWSKIDKNAWNGASRHFDWKCTESCTNRAARYRIRKRRHRRTKLPLTSGIHIPCVCVFQDQTWKVGHKNTREAIMSWPLESWERTQTKTRAKRIPMQFFKGYKLHIVAFLQTNQCAWNYPKSSEKSWKKLSFSYA